jgi:hypothetical protein
MEYASGGELFDYIVAKERLEVTLLSVDLIRFYCEVCSPYPVHHASGARSKMAVQANRICSVVSTF